MNEDKLKIKKYIAIGIGLLIFIPLIFGGRIFPQIFPFNVLQAGMFNWGMGNNAQQVSNSDTSINNSNTSSDVASAFTDLSDPVTILDLEVGDGAVAEPSKTVSVGYVGTRIDPDTGEKIIFDQNLDRDSAFSFELGSGMVIPGFDQGVTGMRIGGKRLVVIKPEMGYGDQQVGDIPPNTTLHFLIELYEVKE